MTGWISVTVIMWISTISGVPSQQVTSVNIVHQLGCMRCIALSIAVFEGETGFEIWKNWSHLITS
ncbi:hypothetical protein SERLA73DRAFT_190772 [Serpula lacrymans var. lacrymans S7.3]|uniref:Secreted protein n=1 Tax=Serpula lacrymans var. lacrymans (strain S7.3) TaxID=936435 RepID=F8QGC1_SERL3|nr:hypothetical protein SERLA73DRAFT_190772 [Serpula lacrymans var. lacrymans S7.3]